MNVSVWSSFLEREAYLGSVTSTHPMESRLPQNQKRTSASKSRREDMIWTDLLCPPEIPFLRAPPTIVSATSVNPNSASVCSTMLLLSSLVVLLGSLRSAANASVSRQVRYGKRWSSDCWTKPITLPTIFRCVLTFLRSFFFDAREEGESGEEVAEVSPVDSSNETLPERMGRSPRRLAMAFRRVVLPTSEYQRRARVSDAELKKKRKGDT